MVIVFWLVFAVLVAMLGDKRRIGFGWALVAAVLLSPLIGLIIVLVSPSKEEDYYREQEREAAFYAPKVSEEQNSIKATAIADELQKIKALKDSGAINDAEYEMLKYRLIHGQ